jgi:uncharacterized damage-inducible protein DinB
MLLGALVLAAAVTRAEGPVPGVAQAPNGPAALAKGFEEVSGWILKAAEMVPADKYDYRPVATVRTVGQQVAHLADAYAYFCGSAKAGRNLEWADTVEKAAGGKAAITAKLKAATYACGAVYAAATPANMPPLMANIAHSNLHYGNLVTYLRMLGLTPPSS